MTSKCSCPVVLLGQDSFLFSPHSYLLLSQDTLLLSLRIFTVLSASRRLLKPGNRYSGNRHPLNTRSITADRATVFKEGLSSPQQVFTDFALGLAQPRVLDQRGWRQSGERAKRAPPRPGCSGEGWGLHLDSPQKPQAGEGRQAVPLPHHEPPGSTRSGCGRLVPAGRYPAEWSPLGRRLQP